MDLGDLESIVRNLEEILKVLKKRKLEDRVLRSRYAKFLVAREITARGYKVQMLDERETRNADLYVPRLDKRIEVKPGIFKFEKGKFFVNIISFGKGKQIENEKFDVCVFVVFKNLKPEFYVFEKKELEEVIKHRRTKISEASEKNPCVFVICRNYSEYEVYLKHLGEKELKVEKDLHKFPEKYKDRWDKIVGEQPSLDMYL